MKTADAIWMCLPEGLNELFEMVRFEKTDSTVYGLADSNIKKLRQKMTKHGQNWENTPNFGMYIQICPILPLENQAFLKNPEKSAA